MTSRVQDESFASHIASPSTWLELAIEWIQKDMEPGDVFTKDQLDTLAADNGWERPE